MKVVRFMLWLLHSTVLVLFALAARLFIPALKGLEKADEVMKRKCGEPTDRKEDNNV